MIKVHSKYIIVGAGLSGLTTAHYLKRNGVTDVLILESRRQIGGRILTHNQIDLGATWFQNHHTYVSQMLKDLDLQKFPQYSKGKSVLVYNLTATAHYFETDPNAPSAYRMANGSISIIHKLAESINNQIHLNTTVTQIEKDDKFILIKTNTNTNYQCEKLVITLPPKIALNIEFKPQLPGDLVHVMEATHTWMSNAIKVGIVFKTPFWRAQGFSGTVIGQVGAVTELYDHSNYKNNHHALMGFVNEDLRHLSIKQRKERIITYLEHYLSKDIRNFTHYFEKDWAQDSFTSNNNLKSAHFSPRYGNPLFENLYFDNALIFSGTETSPIHGGYMDGAIYSGIKTAQKLIALDM